MNHHIYNNNENLLCKDLKEKQFKRLSHYHNGNLATAPVLCVPRLPAHPRRKQVQVESQIFSS